MRHPARALAPLLACAALGCSHAAPSRPEAQPAFSKEAEEARLRQEMSKDIFAEAEAPAPAPAHAAAPAPAAPPPREPWADDDDALKAALGSARGQPPQGCAAALQQARRDHPGGSPAVRQELLSAEVRCHEKAKQVEQARASALLWLVSCGPEAADACRSRAASQLHRLAGQSPKDPEVKGLLKALDKADACLARVEASGKAEGCTGQAESAYRKLDDKLMLTRLHHALGRAAQKAREEPQAEKHLARAVAACAEARCDRARDKAYDALSALLLAQSRAEEAVKARLAQNALAAERAAPELRRYVRLAGLDEACAALDAQRGPGACRAQEFASTGGWTFHDHSQSQLSGDLPKDRILQVNEEYAFTLQDCFREQAARLPVPSSATYKLSWMIGNDGRVAQVKVQPAEEERRALGACLRGRFSLWRYPRSTGEFQHVDQSFTISARPH